MDPRPAVYCSNLDGRMGIPGPRTVTAITSPFKHTLDLSIHKGLNLNEGLMAARALATLGFFLRQVPVLLAVLLTYPSLSLYPTTMAVSLAVLPLPPPPDQSVRPRCIRLLVWVYRRQTIRHQNIPAPLHRMQGVDETAQKVNMRL